MTSDAVAGHVIDLGSRGYFGHVFRKHGNQPQSSFAGADRDQDLIRWLLSFGSGYPVHLHGPGAWRLEEPIRAAGFPAQREEETHPRVTVCCLRESFDALAIQLYGPVERRSTPVTEAGRRDLAGWLRTLGAVSEVVLGDPYGGSAELEADLREQGWPVHVEKLTGAWTVFIDCYPGRYEASARLSPVAQRTSAPASAGGRQALLAWLSDLGPVRRVVVYDAGQDSADLATVLGDALFSVRVERATRGTLATPPGDTIGGVQIQLALRGLGWLEMRLRVNAGSFVLAGSYLTDAWQETLTALTGLLRGAAETQAVWIEEPGSHRFAFSTRDHGMLSVRLFYLAGDMFGTATPAGDGELVLDATVRLADLAMAFVSASHSLLAAVPDIDVRARWHYGPPLLELQEIEALLDRNAIQADALRRPGPRPFQDDVSPRIRKSEDDEGPLHVAAGPAGRLGGVGPASLVQGSDG